MFGVKYNVLYNSVPASKQSMIDIHSRIQSGLSDVNPEDYVVGTEDISHAAKSLKSHKRDAHHSLLSNHVKHGSELLFYHISQLTTSMFIHGCTPDEPYEC